MSQIVIGIPGLWKDRNEIISSIATANNDKKSPRYIALGNLILDSENSESVGFEIYERDQDLAEAFQIAGQGKLSNDILNLINDHTFTVYLILDEEMSTTHEDKVNAARKLLKIGAHVLKSGGIAVKVESTGVAHSYDRWSYYSAQNTTLALYDAFVTMIGSEEYNYTCGMHTFGLPDVSLTKDISNENAPSVMIAFNQWNLLNNNKLKDGQFFRTAYNNPIFEMQLKEYGYDEDDILNNRYGRWHLELSNGSSHIESSDFKNETEPLFMALKKNDSELEKTVEKARKSLGWFLKNFNNPFEYGFYLVKIHLTYKKESAYFWANLIEVKGNKLIVELFEVPAEFKKYKAGKRLKVTEQEIYDWSINRNGTLIGGFSQRLQRKYISQDKLSDYDLRSGTIAILPEEECFKDTE